MRAVFWLLVAACILYVTHFLVPQPNGAGDLAGVLAGAALIFYIAFGTRNDL